MAVYNTFVVVDCKKRKPILVTSSARKASTLLKSGIRIEVWNENKKVETLYECLKKREGNPMIPYITLEREYMEML